MCSPYSTPPRLLQPFWALSLALEVARIWVSTMQEVLKPSGSPLNNPPSLPERASRLSGMLPKPVSAHAAARLQQMPPERLEPGE